MSSAPTSPRDKVKKPSAVVASAPSSPRDMMAKKQLPPPGSNAAPAKKQLPPPASNAAPAKKQPTPPVSNAAKKQPTPLASNAAASCREVIAKVGAAMEAFDNARAASMDDVASAPSHDKIIESADLNRRLMIAHIALLHAEKDMYNITMKAINEQESAFVAPLVSVVDKLSKLCRPNGGFAAPEVYTALYDEHRRAVHQSQHFNTARDIIEAARKSQDKILALAKKAESMWMSIDDDGLGDDMWSLAKAREKSVFLYRIEVGKSFLRPLC